MITARLFSDRARTALLAERKVGPEQTTKRFPIEFTELNTGSVFLELSANAPSGVAVDLYHMLFEATLDTRGVNLPTLKTGENRLEVEDDHDSSHRARIVLRWEDRPAAKRVFR